MFRDSCEIEPYLFVGHSCLSWPRSCLAFYSPNAGCPILTQVKEGSFATYLRGIRERADAVQFRFKNGDSSWFPYSSLGNWKYNPSEGLLLKFSGDVVYLVLIQGSNLDKPLSDSNTNLTTSGLQRHRIVWMREMTEEEIRQVGDTAPTIDRIEVAEFESQAALKEWLSKNAPAFVR
jgi:hypothetical protein